MLGPVLIVFVGGLQGCCDPHRNRSALLQRFLLEFVLVGETVRPAGSSWPSTSFLKLKFLLFKSVFRRLENVLGVRSL